MGCSVHFSLFRSRQRIGTFPPSLHARTAAGSMSCMCGPIDQSGAPSPSCPGDRLWLDTKGSYCVQQKPSTGWSVDVLPPGLSLIHSAQIGIWARLGLRHQMCFHQIICPNVCKQYKGIGVNLNFFQRKHWFCLPGHQLCWFLHKSNSYRNEKTIWSWSLMKG